MHYLSSLITVALISHRDPHVRASIQGSVISILLEYSIVAILAGWITLKFRKPTWPTWLQYPLTAVAIPVVFMAVMEVVSLVFGDTRPLSSKLITTSLTAMDATLVFLPAAVIFYAVSRGLKTK